MSGEMGKLVSNLIHNLANVAIWLCVLGMSIQGLTPKAGFAGFIWTVAIIICWVGIAFDVWRWFANRRAA